MQLVIEKLCLVSAIFENDRVKAHARFRIIAAKTKAIHAVVRKKCAALPGTPAFPAAPS
jgi:hypothetical protein